MQVTYDGALAIASEEADVLVPYSDRGTPAIGFGHQDSSLTIGDKKQAISFDKSWEIFWSDLAIAEKAVERYVHVPLVPHENDPLASLVHNYGPTGFSNLPVVAKLNAGDRKGALEEWRALPSNNGRRQREANTFEKAIYPPLRNRVLLSETGKTALGWHWKHVAPPPPASDAHIPASPIAVVPPSGYHLTWLPQVLFEAGLNVTERLGWNKRGHGDMIGVTAGVICHHTAGPRTGNAPDLDVIVNGRPGLAGPLANLHLARDGAFTVVAAGLCYHAGAGSWRGITRGNERFVGIEAENTGLDNDQPWPEVQMVAYAKGCAAIVKRLGLGAEWVIGHKEWAPTRKIDPTFDMVQFRARVSSFLKGTGIPAPPPVVIPPAVPGDKFVVVGVKPDTLAFRAGPAATEKQTGKLPEGTVVTKVGEKGTWFQIVTPGGFKGWSAKRYLKAA